MAQQKDQQSFPQPRVVRPAQSVRPQIRQRAPRQMPRQEMSFVPPRFQQMRPPRPLRRLPTPPIRQASYHEWQDPYTSFGQQVYDHVSYGNEYYEPTQEHSYDQSYDYGPTQPYSAAYQQPYQVQPPPKRPRWLQQRQHVPTATAPPPGGSWSQVSWDQSAYQEFKQEVKEEPSFSTTHPKIHTHSKNPIEISSGEEDVQTEASHTTSSAHTAQMSSTHDEQYTRYDESSYYEQQYTTYDDAQLPQYQDPTLTDEAQQNLEANQGGQSEAGAEYEVGPGDDDHWFPPEFYVKVQRSEDEPKKTKLARTEFIKNMKQRPWTGDDEVLDLSLIKAPRAVISVSSKPKTEKKGKSRPCWIRLHRAWARDNFTRHFIGPGNIRYRGMTYCSICHHTSTPWDCHPLCWRCYLQLDLPLCGLQPDIECEFCDVMGFNARNARNDKLSAAIADPEFVVKETVKTGLPSNVYTQADADCWTNKKKSKETPNPDWFQANEPVGSCFPAALIEPGQSIADAKLAHPEWTSEDNYKNVKAYNNSIKDRTHVTTHSQRKTVYIPKCLVWGTKRSTQLDEAIKHHQTESQELVSQIESREQRFTTMMNENKAAIEALNERLAPIIAAQKSSQVSLESVIDNFTNEDLKSACKNLTAQSSGEFNEADIRRMSQEELSAILISVQQRVIAQKDADEQKRTARSSRETSVDRTKKRDGRDSPWLRRQNEEPSVEQLYQEKNMRLREWKGVRAGDINVPPVPSEPADDKFAQMLSKLKDMGVEVHWRTMTVKTGEKSNSYHTPKIEPHFLAEFWKILSDIQNQDPFDLNIEMPAEVGACLGVGPHYNLESEPATPDKWNQHPIFKDVVMMRHREAIQLKRLNQAIGAFNNIISAATRALSMTLEKLQDSMQTERQEERLITSVIREASTTVNKLAARATILSESIIRRDLMLRTGTDPTSYPHAFASPYMRANQLISEFGS